MGFDSGRRLSFKWRVILIVKGHKLYPKPTIRGFTAKMLTDLRFVWWVRENSGFFSNITNSTVLACIFYEKKAVAGSANFSFSHVKRVMKIWWSDIKDFFTPFVFPFYEKRNMCIWIFHSLHFVCTRFELNTNFF